MDPFDEIKGLLPALGHGRRVASPYRLLEVAGPDAADYLHRLCTQQVLALEPGRAAPAAFLSAKGRLQALAVVARLDEERLCVETQAGTAERLAELLDRYHFSERLELRPATDLDCVELCGVDLPEAAGREPWTVRQSDSGVVELAGKRRGLGFVRAHGPAELLESWQVDVAPLDEALADCLRIATGQVLVGVDSEESTLALEPDLDDHVHLDKGCYTGQEIVARIHTYGHVNRRLVPLRVATAAPLERQTALVDEDGDPVGRLMSARAVPGADWSVAIGVLPNAFLEVGGELRVGTSDGPEATRIALRDN